MLGRCGKEVCARITNAARFSVQCPRIAVKLIFEGKQNNDVFFVCLFVYFYLRGFYCEGEVM